jgi:hypothetical protein
MLLLTSTSDLVQVITGAASTINVRADFVDYVASGPTYTPGRTNTPTISTATTTTIVGSPAASTYRNVRSISVYNNDSANSCQITVQHTDGTNVEPLFSCNLGIGEKITFTQGGQWLHYDKFGGIYQAAPQATALFNSSTASQGAGFSSDTYLTGSAIAVPSSFPKVGTLYTLKFQVAKTAAGTATPIINVRYGTAGTTADASIATLTFAAGTAAADTGWFEVDVLFRTVGTGTSAVVAATANLTNNLTTTGFSNAVKVVEAVSSGFASSVANSIIGVSVNGGTSAAWTVQQVESRLENF